jgi:hypothetical protein
MTWSRSPLHEFRRVCRASRQRASIAESGKRNGPMAVGSRPVAVTKAALQASKLAPAREIVINA